MRTVAMAWLNSPRVIVRSIRSRRRKLPPSATVNSRKFGQRRKLNVVSIDVTPDGMCTVSMSSLSEKPTISVTG